MTEKHSEAKAPFTPEQLALICQIVKEELAAFEKRQLQERRFGKPYPPQAETK